MLIGLKIVMVIDFQNNEGYQQDWSDASNSHRKLRWNDEIKTMKAIR